MYKRQALGLAVRFPLEETPSVEDHPVKTHEDLRGFRKIDILGDGRVSVFIETLHHMRSAFPCPVGAYVIGPLTLAGLLIGANELAIKSLIEPELFRETVEFSYQVEMCIRDSHEMLQFQDDQPHYDESRYKECWYR